MKTVSGKVISSKPMSLSKAAKTLSKFVTFENGASHAINIYLQRACTAFDELVQFHKELKTPKSRTKSKNPESHSVILPPQETGLSAEPSQAPTGEPSQEPDSGCRNYKGGGSSDHKQQKTNKKRMDEDEPGNIQKSEGYIEYRKNDAQDLGKQVLNMSMEQCLADGAEDNVGVVSEKKKHKKKLILKGGDGDSVESAVEVKDRIGDSARSLEKANKAVSQSNDVEQGTDGEGFVEQRSKKKKKKKRREDDGVVHVERESSKDYIGSEERRTKRKSRVDDEGRHDDGSVDRKHKKAKTNSS